jgi:hypothetical protein
MPLFFIAQVNLATMVKPVDRKSTTVERVVRTQRQNA